MLPPSKVYVFAVDEIYEIGESLCLTKGAFSRTIKTKKQRNKEIMLVVLVKKLLYKEW